MQRAPIGALCISSSIFLLGLKYLAGVWVGYDTGLVLLRPSGGAAAASRLLEAVAVAVHGQDADVVGEPVEQRAGEALGC
jgi:hypothetical protein